MYLLNLLFYGQDIRIDFSILLSIYDMCAKVWMKTPREPDLDKYREVMRAEERYREQKVTYILYEKI